MDELEALQNGDVIVFTFGRSTWVAPVVAEPHTVSMYRDDNPTRVVRVAMLREQFDGRPNFPNNTALVPLTDIVAY